MQTDDRDRLSRIRQSLAELAEEVPRLVPIFAERTALMEGTVYEQKRKCGKPNCHCATGEPHRSMIVSRSENGRTQLSAIPSGDLKDCQVLTARYQRFRAARARLGRIYKTMLSLIDQLEESRRRES